MSIYNESLSNKKGLFIDMDVLNKEYDMSIFAHLVRDTKVSKKAFKKLY